MQIHEDPLILEVPRKDVTNIIINERETQELAVVDTRLKKEVADRAAEYKPSEPLEDLRGMRDVAKLALPELVEFVDNAYEYMERLTEENEQLRRELEEKEDGDE